jgi:uncharacterized protein (DUF58 family)
LKTFIRIVKQIKSRPNRYFALLTVTIIGLFSLAYIHNYNIVYLMMFFAFSLAAASSLIGRLNLDPVRTSVLSCERLFASAPSTCRIALYNTATRPLYAITCSNTLGSRYLQRIEPEENEIVALTMRFEKRGEARMEALTLSSHFPLPHELFYKSLPLDKNLLVYPEPKGEPLAHFCETSHAFIGERDEFEGLRPYQHGDHLSLVHWPSLAIGTGMMSRLFSHTAESTALHFDFRTAANDDESRLSQLTLWVLECEKQAVDYTIDMPKKRLDSKKMTTDEILTHLARF